MSSAKIEQKDAEFSAIRRAHAITLREPVWAAKNILGVDLDPWQEELLEAVFDTRRRQLGMRTRINHEGKNRISVRAGHGPGKTFGVAVVAHLWFFAHRALGFATAPKEKQLHERLWPALRKVRQSAIPEYQRLVRVDRTKMYFVNDPDWGLNAETASSPDNLAGYHDDYILEIVEEASGVDEKFFPVIDGAVSTGKCPVQILIGNPTRNSGTFFMSHTRPQLAHLYHRVHVTVDKAPRVSREWIAGMVAKYGRDSAVVKVRCYGEFADESDSQVISLAWLDQANARSTDSDGGLPIRKIAIDVADGGECDSVCTVGTEYQTKLVLEKQVVARFSAAESSIRTAQLGVDLWKAHGFDARNGDYFIVDAVGVGAGTAGYLLDKGYPVVCNRGGESSDDPKRWRNRRTQNYIVARDYYRDGRIAHAEGFVDDWDDFAAQLTALRYKANGERVDDIETKDDLTRRGVKSPDRADSAVMLLSGKSPQLTTQIVPRDEVLYFGGDTVTSAYDGGLT